MTTEELIILIIVIAVLVILFIIILIKFASPATMNLVPLNPATPPSSTVVSTASVQTVVTPTPPGYLTAPDPVSQIPSGYRPTERSFSQAYFAPYLATTAAPSSFLTLSSLSQPLLIDHSPTTTYSYNSRSKQLVADKTGSNLGKVRFFDSGRGFYIIADMKGEVLKYNPNSLQLSFGHTGNKEFMPLPLQILRRG